MNRVEIKNYAKQNVVGKRLNIFLCTFIYGLVAGVISIFAMPMDISILWLTYEAVKNNRTPQVEDLLGGYKDLSNSIKFIGLELVIGIFTFLWSLLFFIPGFVKSYSYSAAPYIFLLDPNKPIMECITESRKLMNGNKMDKFVFDLSFFPHILLGIITCGIYLLYFEPYYMLANARYYQLLLNDIPTDNTTFDGETVDAEYSEVNNENN
ncbi:MAG: DUF975 family protein [Anaeroplasmataceae bacterium]